MKDLDLSSTDIKPPKDFLVALAKNPRAKATWDDITPKMRRDWILWIVSAKKPETKVRRMEKACDMLSQGKRRVCCFGGANWLIRSRRTS